LPVLIDLQNRNHEPYLALVPCTGFGRLDRPTHVSGTNRTLLVLFDSQNESYLATINRILILLMACKGRMSVCALCMQRYFGTAVGKGRQGAKTEIERLKLLEISCREGVAAVAKM
jgi:hypothetical protein